MMTIPTSNSPRDSRGKFSMNFIYQINRYFRFREFASVEYNGCEYMTPQDFLDCLILDEPRERVFRKVLNPETVKSMLRKTPPLRKGSSTMFRQLGHNGLISYAEYVFLITLLTSEFCTQLIYHPSL